jgi:hypothetical protein
MTPRWFPSTDQLQRHASAAQAPHRTYTIGDISPSAGTSASCSYSIRPKSSTSSILFITPDDDASLLDP